MVPRHDVEEEAHLLSAANEADSRPAGLLSPEAARRLSLLPPATTVPAMSMGDAALGGCCTVGCCGIGCGEGLLVSASGDASGARGSPADGLRPRSEATVDVSDVVLLGGNGRMLDLTYQRAESHVPFQETCASQVEQYRGWSCQGSALSQSQESNKQRGSAQLMQPEKPHLARARPG